MYEMQISSEYVDKRINATFTRVKGAGGDPVKKNDQNFNWIMDQN